jgi:uncharacterized protein
LEGITDLKSLLSSLTPVLSDRIYVFSRISAIPGIPFINDCWAIIKEDEAVTVVATIQNADKWGLDHSSPFGRITLQVHSSLEAVGLTASVSTRLSSHGISSNIISGYYHDHVFVPKDRADEAMRLLVELSNENKI